MVEISKKYRTKSGHPVHIHEIKETGHTFPVKGSIIVKHKSGIRHQYAIWTKDGKHQVAKESEFDLVEV